VKNLVANGVLISLLAAGAPAIAETGPGASRLNAKIIEQVRSYLAADIVQMSVKDQNQRNTERSDDDIAEMDAVWRKETESKAKPLISATLSNPLSAYLTRLQAHSDGLFTEIFVMDDKGLNVGQSTISSDYWQGDEAKWQKTYSVGAGSIYVDEPEYDADLKAWLVQLNVSVDDTSGKRAIGAATFQINISEMQRRG
jgi:hypothetical protein